MYVHVDWKIKPGPRPLREREELQGTDGEIPQLGNPASDSHFSNTRLGNYG
jgi:hypothetical protein